MTRTYLIGVIVVFISASVNHAANGQSVNAPSNFNSSGYTLGQPLDGQGSNDAGWGGNNWGTWFSNGFGGPTTTVVAYSDSTAYEGDGDLQMLGTVPSQCGAHRTWGTNLTTPFWIDQKVRLTSGTTYFVERVGTGGTVDTTEVRWQVGNGDFMVWNAGTELDTGIAVKPSQWQDVSLLISPQTNTYQFFVDGQQYVGSTLSFQNNLGIVNQFNYLSNQTAYVDAVQVFSAPEPGTASLVAFATVGLLLFFKRRALA
jgi:hypothetical protein